MIALMPVYRYWLDGSILAIEDLGGPVAVTVAAEYVLLEIKGQIGSLSDYYVVYRDREGVWDGLIHRAGKLLIYPLSAPTYQAAKDKLNQRIGQQGELAVRYEPAGD